MQHLALELRSNGSQFCPLEQWFLNWNVSKATRLQDYLPQLQADCAPPKLATGAYEEL